MRLFSVFGEGLRKQLLWDVGNRIRSGEDPVILGGAGTEMRDWIHVQDAVRIMELVATAASPECIVVNGGSGTGTAVRDVVAQFARAMGSAVRVEFSGSIRAGDPRFLVADASWLRTRQFAIHVPVEHGLRRYAEWLTSSESRK